MSLLSINACVEAVCTPNADPLFSGNPLVEALPPSHDDLNLLRSIQYLPEFVPADRELPISARIHRVFELAISLVPLQRHLELCRQLDALMKMSYIGRAPRTEASASIAQALYERQLAGETFRQVRGSVSPQLSTAIFGVPGVGKTTVISRYLATIPQVIYHRSLGIYQVPYLVVEAPSDGTSVKGLAYAILNQLDQLIPGAHYFQQFVTRSKFGADALMRQVARLMNIHCVGLLVVDEVQNLSNARKGTAVLVTELVSACNELKVALLFVGTYKGIEVLSQDFRQARRAAGFGPSLWDRLPEQAVGAGISEWRQFLEIIWQYQWVRNPVPLDDRLSSLLYSCSQGVIGIVIRLLISAQVHAMLDGTETLTEASIESVFESDFYTVRPMLQALRDGNIDDIKRYEDIALPDLEEIQKAWQSEAASRCEPINTILPGHVEFIPRLIQALIAAGVDPERATELAEGAAAEPRPRTVAQALIECTKRAQPATRKRKRLDKGPRDTAHLPADDYRVAIAAAEASGADLGDEMRSRGMALTAREVLNGDFLGA